MSKPDSRTLADWVAAIAASRPFRPDVVGRLMGLSLYRSVAESDAFFDVSRAVFDASAPLFTGVEVRSRTTPAVDGDGMVLLDVQPGLFTRRSVWTLFGAPSVSLVPAPDLPAHVPTYVTCGQPWGAVRLGFSRRDASLVRIILDAADEVAGSARLSA